MNKKYFEMIIKKSIHSGRKRFAIAPFGEVGEDVYKYLKGLSIEPVLCAQ